jgi:predicted nicotinamide N-methyase
MKTSELNLLKLYQTHSKYKDYWTNEDVIDWKLQLIPESLEGKTVLDIGAFEGFYSIVCEQRGAKRVVAIDNNKYHNNFCYKEIMKCVSTEVEPHCINLIYLNSILKEPFDIVLLFDVLSYIEEPLTALKAIRKMVGQELIVCDTISNDQETATMQLLNTENDNLPIWLVSENCVRTMLYRADLFPMQKPVPNMENRASICAIPMNKAANRHGIEHRVLNI